MGDRSWRVGQTLGLAWGYLRSSEFTNLTMALATVAIAVFTWLTYEVVSSSSQDTQRLITAAELQARAAGKISGAADKFSTSAEGVEKHTGNAVEAMRKSNEITRNAVMSVQRAFVGMVGVEASKHTVLLSSGGSEVQWHISGNWFNSGNTPAPRALEYFSYRVLPEEPSGDIFRGNATEPYTTHIGPKEPRDTGWVGEPESAIPVAPNDVGNHYFWGWIVYYDVFEQPHLTEFCWKLRGTEMTRDGSGARFMTKNCNQHNCTDRYCLDYKKMLSFSATRLEPN